MNNIINELLSTAYDKSDVFNSDTYKELETKINKLNDILVSNIDENTFNEYSDTRTDFELLFYQYGFLEGIKFISKLTGTPIEHLLNPSIYEECEIDL